MKKFFTLLIMFCIILPVFAVPATPSGMKNLPQGSFKKKKNGTFVQYDNRGKKIGTYKLDNGNLTKIK